MPTIVSTPLMGANRECIESRLPHVGDLLSGSISDVVSHADVCIVDCRIRCSARAVASSRFGLVIVCVPSVTESMCGGAIEQLFAQTGDGNSHDM